ncbi:hypothetical protein ACMS1Z_05725 [Acidiphilium multivorum]|uniref:hypothetical protein n=1 Tax=Acidiphilium multivorum TaxID=62140 RepID=UPI0039C9BB7F
MATIFFISLSMIFIVLISHFILLPDERNNDAKVKLSDAQSSYAEPPTMTPLEKAEATIRGLEAVVSDTQARFAALEVQHGQLISDLHDARETIRSLKAEQVRAKPATDTGGRFGRLKSLIIRELHPDGKPDAGAIERTVRTELFKHLWPEIERIERGA